MAEPERGPKVDGELPVETAGDIVDRAAAEAATVERARPRLPRGRGPQAEELRRKLDEKAAATDELREALHELRQVLDVENPPQPAGSHHRRTRIAVLAGTLVAVTALVVALLYDHSPGGIVASTSTPPTTASAPASAPAASAPGDPAVAGAIPARTVPAGTQVTVTVDTEGNHLDVVEQLTLDAAIRGPLTLQVPASPLPDAPIRIEALRVRADDGPAMSLDGARAGGQIVIPAAGPSTRLTLQYRISGGIVRVAPAAPGRALGLVTPLTGQLSLDHGHRVQIRTASAGVLGVSCPTTGTGALCGAHLGDSWVATVPGQAGPVVVLQLDTRR